MTKTEVTVERGEQITLGRGDYGWGVTATEVTVDGEPFAERGGSYFTQCGFCHYPWSGSKPVFGHVMSGVCFQCTGRGWNRRYESLDDIVRIAKRRKSDRARRARKEAERLTAQDAERAAWVAANADLAATLQAIAAEVDIDPGTEAGWAAYEAATKRWGNFVIEAAQQAQHRPLSEKHTAAVAAAVARQEAWTAQREAEQAAQRYAEGAKVTDATGTVTVATSFENDYGYSALRVIRGTGDWEGVTFKVMGSGKTLWACGKGDTVEVTGGIKDRSEYEGTKQTVLTRAKIKVLVSAEESA